MTAEGPVDVVIAGAGIVGAACAAAFAEAGLSVAVVEPGVVGGGATAQGMGHVVAMDGSEAEFALTRYSRSLWSSLAAELPKEAEYTACGTLWVAADEEELAGARARHEFLAGNGVRAEMLDPAALREEEPNLRDGLAGALLVPQDCAVYAPVAAKWLLDRARDKGARLVGGTAVRGFERGEALLTDGSRVAAKYLVNAAGAWAAELGIEIPTVVKKGHLAITDRYPGFARRQIIELGYMKSAHDGAKESVAFNVQPRPTGQLLVGSSRQVGVATSQVEPRMLSAMLRRAIEYMPALAGLSVIRSWTGLRAATPDNLPVIGPHPNRPDILLATGHEGLGITTSLGTAQLLADRILEREPAIPVEPYLPDRLFRTKEELA